jgi:hypothetical protein
MATIEGNVGEGSFVDGKEGLASKRSGICNGWLHDFLGLLKAL